ncbi:MAG: glycosyltransferase family 2 protein [Bacteroidia bacterium]
MSNQARIAVVVLNFNTRALLAQCLPVVLRESRDPGVEVIVVDNCSHDGSAEFVRDSFPEIRVMELTENLGYAGGYNQALQVLDHDYFVLLNSDAEPAENWLSPLLELAENNPQFGCAQPHILDYQHRQRFEYAGAAGGYMDRYGYPFCRGRIFGQVEENQGQYSDSRRVFWATGAALFIKRDAWMAAGGLDTAFFAHFEEIDLCWRLQLKGYQVWSCAQSQVYHMGGGTLANQSPRKTYLNFRNNLLMLYKNLPSEVMNKRILQRKLLDSLAAVLFLLQGKPRLIWEIAKAHRDFERIKSQFTRSEAPLPLTQLSGSLNASLVFGYFLRGRKTWKSWDLL